MVGRGPGRCGDGVDAAGEIYADATVQAPGQRLLTTQLYFPGEPANARDDFFHPELLMRVAGPGAGMAARFDFVIDIR